MIVCSLAVGLDGYYDPKQREAIETAVRQRLALPVEREQWQSHVEGHWRPGIHQRAARYRFVAGNLSARAPVYLLADTYGEAGRFAEARHWRPESWRFINDAYKLNGQRGGLYVIVGRFRRRDGGEILRVADGRGMTRWAP